LFGTQHGFALNTLNSFLQQLATHVDKKGLRCKYIRLYPVEVIHLSQSIVVTMRQ